MPGRPRNVDRQTIEAFARIHEGRAGAANGIRRPLNSDNGISQGPDQGNGPGRSPEHGAGPGSGVGPDVARSAPLYVPTEPAHVGYLPPMPNLERPRMGRRVTIACIATVVVILIALGIAGATGGHRGRSHLRAETTASVPSASGPTSGGRSVGQSAHGPGARASTTTLATGPIAPRTTSSGSVQFQMASAPFTVTIAAVDGSCWAEAAASSGATVTWAGTVVQGGSHVLAPGSSWWLRLGAPEYVTVTVNGRRLQLPATSSPLDVGISSA
jgi:hypothetical protein